jgi:hypothetical protein
LALHQTDLVAQALRAGHPGLEIEVQIVRTRGDDLSAPLDQIGGQGVFVTAIEAAVAEGRADAAVHSAKDMTSTMAAGLVLAAVPPRADPRDGLVGCPLRALPAGGLVATGSARRRAQLAYLRPDLSFTEIRGNMERRVSHGEDGSVSAVVVAVAAMERLGWMERLTDILDPLDVLPRPARALSLCNAAPTTRRRGLFSPPSTIPTHTGRFGPSDRYWPVWAGAAPCRWQRGPNSSVIIVNRRWPSKGLKSPNSPNCGCMGSWPAATGESSSG